MAEHQHLEIPHAEMPEYLRGLKPPVSTEEALAYAEERGAPPEVLEFMEALPSAVFTSEEGMRHAFSSLRDGDLRGLSTREADLAHDGTSS